MYECSAHLCAPVQSDSRGCAHLVLHCVLALHSNCDLPLQADNKTCFLGNARVWTQVPPSAAVELLSLLLSCCCWSVVSGTPICSCWIIRCTAVLAWIRTCGFCVSCSLWLWSDSFCMCRVIIRFVSRIITPFILQPLWCTCLSLWCCKCGLINLAMCSLMDMYCPQYLRLRHKHALISTMMQNITQTVALEHTAFHDQSNFTFDFSPQGPWGATPYQFK